MQQQQVLFLGSSSASRQQLLKEVGIQFTLLKQTADEAQCDWGQTLQKVVESIALFKMQHVIMPVGKEGDIAFVLTADTLGQDSKGHINGKPTSKEHAIELIQEARAGMSTGTAFCLEKKEYKNQQWHTVARIVRYVQAQYQFIIPDEWMDYYFSHCNALQVSGAIAIEGVGSLFLREMHGSYTTVMGLPVFELRESLVDIGFFDKKP
ncbi:MAG TPA: Maf family protein [Candidatus Babeliales bacterium]|nr:Maf family protein [Candidatus Babeliales bacterium]